jgi:hypothetical protein
MGVPKVKTKNVVETTKIIRVKIQRINSHVQNTGINLIHGTVNELQTHKFHLPLKICFNLLQSSNGISA